MIKENYISFVKPFWFSLLIHIQLLVGEVLSGSSEKGT